MYVMAADIAGLMPVAPSEATIGRWIEKAETRLAVKLQQRGRSLAALAGDPATLPVVNDVLENAVLRVLRNLGGARAESEGDYSITHNPLDASGNIWFPDEDLDLLAPRSTVGSIPIGLPAHRLPTRRCR